LAGRDYVPKGAGCVPGSVADQEGYVSGYKGDGSYKKDLKQPSKPTSVSVKMKNKQKKNGRFC